MEPEWKDRAGSPLSPPSLRLLVPPVRLMSAFMWRVAQQGNVMQYDKLADFIALVTEMVPELLSLSQRAELILGLRARLILELCHDDGLANLHSIQNNLDKIQACTMNLSSALQECGHKDLKSSYTDFSKLVQKLMNVPFEKEYFFQEIFPVNYGSTYDQTMQQLVSQFLCRLDELLPAPHFTQAATWLTETPSVAEELKQHLSDPSALKTLLLHHRQMGILSAGTPCSQEDTVLSTLAIPPQVEKYVQGSSEDEECSSGTLEMGALEGEDSSQSSNVASEEWLPAKTPGQLSKLYSCPQCSFSHQTLQKLQEHLYLVHQAPDPLPEKEPAAKVQGSRVERRKRKDQNIENRQAKQPKSDSRKKRARPGKRRKMENDGKAVTERRARKEPGSEDRRFLNSRPANKTFAQEETKCPKCEKAFELPNQLKTHMKLHGLPYRCLQCEKGFSSKSGHYQHQRLHKRGRIFTCTHCQMGFLCSYSLKQHERLHSEGPTHLCSVCGKRFSKVGIVRHMLMHKGQRDYLCTTCGKSFLSSGELLLHTRTHTGETPYTCTHCGKGFATKSHLIVHVRSHTGERPYPCSKCAKSFLTIGCLKRHTLCHDGVKPFKCSACGKEFSQNGNLKRHLTTHQPDT